MRDAIGELRGASSSGRLAEEFGWDVTELDVGHDAMVIAPEKLADILLEHA